MITNEQWASFIQDATDTAHAGDFARELGHRDGFCLACAETYRSISIAITKFKFIEGLEGDGKNS